MSIEKITVKERLWNTEKEEYEDVTSTYERATYNGDFDYLVLSETPRFDIKNYAAEEYDMIDEEDCDCDDVALYSLPDEDFITEARERGFVIVKTVSITDLMKVEQLLETIK